jgi:hypothetical protein
MIIVLSLAALTAWGVLATATAIASDDYRRVPTAA